MIHLFFSGLDTASCLQYVDSTQECTQSRILNSLFLFFRLKRRFGNFNRPSVFCSMYSVFTSSKWCYTAGKLYIWPRLGWNPIQKMIWCEWLHRSFSRIGTSSSLQNCANNIWKVESCIQQNLNLTNLFLNFYSCLESLNHELDPQCEVTVLK